MEILEIKNLEKDFGGVRAIENLSLSFRAGAITSIIGPNGSGKSTLVNVLTGLYAFDGGVVVVRGREYSAIPPHHGMSLGVTRTFQEVRLFNQMSVLDNILVVLSERGVFAALRARHTPEHLREAERLLRAAHLWEKRHTLAGNCSYGQRKLLEIARVLAMNTDIILFDEPFAGLFPEVVRQVAEIMKQLRASGKTILLVEHNMDLVRELSDFVVVMDAGKRLAEGAPGEVLSDPKVIEAYLGA